MVPSALRRRVLLSGTMLAAAVVGYGRRAYGQCAPTVAPNYQCSGANAATQMITANNASISTVAGFSVNTPGNAITITGDGALSYTDTNASSLTAAVGFALHVRSLGDDVGGTPGSVTIDTNGALSGLYGIYSRNEGAGALTITANGNVAGTGNIGIYALNESSGTALSVTTGAVTSGGTNGISVRNLGTGALTITANGNVAGSTNQGIFARNFGTALSVTTAAGTTVSGGVNGIFARNLGTGALTVTANGNVTGTSGYGISARTYGTGTTLTVTTAAGTTVSGGNNGILARSDGTGALTVTIAATSTVSGGSGFGIQARGRPATVTVAGTLNGGAGGAIQFDQAGAFANRLELVTGAVIVGNLLGGTGTDTLGLSGGGFGQLQCRPVLLVRGRRKDRQRQLDAHRHQRRLHRVLGRRRRAPGQRQPEQRGFHRQRRHARRHRHGRQYLGHRRHLRAGLGRARLVDDGQRHARLQCGVDLSGQRQPDDGVVRQRLGHGHARRRDGECQLRAGQLYRQAVHHPDGRQRERNVQSDRRQHQSSGELREHAELRWDARLSEFGVGLHRTVDRRVRQPGQCRQRPGQILQ